MMSANEYCTINHIFCLWCNHFVARKGIAYDNEIYLIAIFESAMFGKSELLLYFKGSFISFIPFSDYQQHIRKLYNSRKNKPH